METFVWWGLAIGDANTPIRPHSRLRSTGVAVCRRWAPRRIGAFRSHLRRFQPEVCMIPTAAQVYPTVLCNPFRAECRGEQSHFCGVRTGAASSWDEVSPPTRIRRPETRGFRPDCPDVCIRDPGTPPPPKSRTDREPLRLAWCKWYRAGIHTYQVD